MSARGKGSRAYFVRLGDNSPLRVDADRMRVDQNGTLVLSNVISRAWVTLEMDVASFAGGDWRSCALDGVVGTLSA
jgi:hypothetical protein